MAADPRKRQPGLLPVGAAGRRRAPSARRHAGPGPAGGDRPDGGADRQRASRLPRAVRLRGPADVVGIDRHQVVRTDPRPGTSDFEPNCFPRSSSTAPTSPGCSRRPAPTRSAQLRPWLCLVVVREQDGVPLRSTGDAPLPALEIAAPAKPFAEELPDLSDPGRGRTGRPRAPPTRAPSGCARAQRLAAALAVAAGVPAPADAEHRLPRLRRADLRARTQGRTRPGDRRQRADQPQRRWRRRGR